jgi:hypothetical protein
MLYLIAASYILYKVHEVNYISAHEYFIDNTRIKGR